MIRHATVFYLVWNDGTREMYTTSTKLHCREYVLENQGFERDLDYITYSDLIPEDDLYY
jgi:hypothetical protein